MSNETTIEDRLNLLEQTVSNLQKKIESSYISPNWLDNLIGSISDESAFLRSLEYGRAFRQSGDIYTNMTEDNIDKL
ncbi:MAG: transferase hexapeptide repeat containing protein [Cyanobacteria bacterium J06649_4]